MLPYEADSVTIPILQMKKLRLKGCNGLFVVTGYKVVEQLDLRLLDPEAQSLILDHYEQAIFSPTRGSQ